MFSLHLLEVEKKSYHCNMAHLTALVEHVRVNHVSASHAHQIQEEVSKEKKIQKTKQRKQNVLSGSHSIAFYGWLFTCIACNQLQT